MIDSIVEAQRRVADAAFALQIDQHALRGLEERHEREHLEASGRIVETQRRLTEVVVRLARELGQPLPQPGAQQPLYLPVSDTQIALLEWHVCGLAARVVPLAGRAQ